MKAILTTLLMFRRNTANLQRGLLIFCVVCFPGCLVLSSIGLAWAIQYFVAGLFVSAWLLDSLWERGAVEHEAGGFQTLGLAHHNDREPVRGKK